MTGPHWLLTKSTTLPLDAPDALAAAIVKSVHPSVELLGFGEALHGGAEILQLRNSLFRALAKSHGYCAIAIESSSVQARAIQDYIAGRLDGDDEAVKSWFGHGMGQLTANQELIEWMRQFNADSARSATLRFYGFDIPSGPRGVAAPRRALEPVFTYLASASAPMAERYRGQFQPLFGNDAQWENAAGMMDPAQSIGASPMAHALRIATEDLIAELRERRPELTAQSHSVSFLEALHFARVARELLNFHAALASRKPGGPPDRVLGVRDALMADHLACILDRERARGKVFVFAHNSHLQRGKAIWPGQKYWQTDDPCEWWPAGSILNEMLGPRYAAIGTAVAESADNGIAPAEHGSLENILQPPPAQVRLCPTGLGNFKAGESKKLARRSGSAKNPTFVPLTAQSLTDFDALAVFGAVAYNRGGPPLGAWG